MANIKSVSELILDENKLVTYISVSKELCVHVNESKILLKEVVKEIKKKQPNIHLNVNYIISGLLTDNTAKTVVCSEAELDTEKSKFRNIFYQHIYSVSQGLSGVDNVAIVSVNKFEDFSLCTGLIKSNKCTKRSSDEIGKLKSKSQAAVEKNLTVVARNHIKDKPNDIANGTHRESSNGIVKAHLTKSVPSIKSEIISPQKDTSNSSNGKIKTTNSKKTSKGIAGFFSKANSAPSIEQTKPQENGQKPVVRSGGKYEVKKENEMEFDVEDEEIQLKKTEEEPEKTSKKRNQVDDEVKGKGVIKKVKKEPESTSKSTAKKTSSLSKIKKTAKVDKKRKRVLHVSDSESDEDPFADNKPVQESDDDEIPPTPSNNTVKVTSGMLNPKKKRKIVDKTYTDEDGYILTRKEEVYESCSDDEVEAKQSEEPVKHVEKENIEKVNKIKTQVSPKGKKASTSKKKISPPQKGKQATMMNFFKKI